MNQSQQFLFDRYKDLNRYVKEGQILFTGSSLMEHFPIEELRGSLDIGPVIYNRGIGGFTTDDFLECIDTVLLAPKASRIFRNIGTNDISERFNADGQWLEHLITNYELILNKLRESQPSCEVYLMAYYPANQKVIASDPGSLAAFGFRTPERLREACRAVEMLSEKYHCHYINVNEGLTDARGDLKEEFTIDGVHMTPTAYVRILRNLMPYII